MIVYVIRRLVPRICAQREQLLVLYSEDLSKRVIIDDER